MAEDNSLNQRIVNFILQKQNAKVTITPNGSVAIDEMRQTAFDIILMDIQMPERDGYEATRYIRDELRSLVPIIALSASKLEDDQKKCIAAGMNTCISKPFDPVELCELILKVLKETKVTA